jgi:hypothetical protein
MDLMGFLASKAFLKGNGEAIVLRIYRYYFSSQGKLDTSFLGTSEQQ